MALCLVCFLPGLLFARLALGLFEFGPGGWVNLGPDWFQAGLALGRVGLGPDWLGAGLAVGRVGFLPGLLFARLALDLVEFGPALG